MSIDKTKLISLKIISDGDPNNTKIVDQDGRVLDDVTKISWDIAANRSSRTFITLDHIPIELNLDQEDCEFIRKRDVTIQISDPFTMIGREEFVERCMEAFGYPAKINYALGKCFTCSVPVRYKYCDEHLRRDDNDN